MKMMNHGCLLSGLMILLGAALHPAAARSYPDKPIKLVVPFGPGGGTDTLSRLVARKMESALGQTIVVENRPGANTIIGAETVARAQPDGYTLLLTLDLTMTMNPSLYSKLPYGPEDFAPIGVVARSPVIFITSAKQSFQTLQEFIAHARANPGKMTFGAGTISSQVVGEKLARDNGMEMVYVNYKSGAEALMGLVAGDTQFSIMDIATVVPFLKDGRVRGLAVSSEKRSPALPDVPTVGEAGLPEMNYLSWWGLYAPAGTPQSVIGRLNRELGKALASPDLAPRLTALNYEPAHSTPQALLKKQRDEAQTMSKTIKAANISLD